AETRQPGDGGEEQNGGAALVLARRMAPDAIDVRRRHEPQSEREIERDADVPADQNAGGAVEARRPQDRDEDADQRREEQARANPDHPHRAAERGGARLGARPGPPEIGSAPTLPLSPLGIKTCCREWVFLKMRSQKMIHRLRCARIVAMLTP